MIRLRVQGAAGRSSLPTTARSDRPVLCKTALLLLGGLVAAASGAGCANYQQFGCTSPYSMKCAGGIGGEAAGTNSGKEERGFRWLPF